MRQPAGRLTAPLPSGNRVGVSGGTDPDPEAALADGAAGADALRHASVSARSSYRLGFREAAGLVVEHCGGRFRLRAPPRRWPVRQFSCCPASSR